MSHQDVSPRLLGAIVFVTLFAACSPQRLDCARPAADAAARRQPVQAASGSCQTAR